MGANRRTTQGAWGGRMVLGPGQLLFVGPAGAAARHAHHAVQLVWGLERELALEVERGAVRRRATVVAPNVRHAFDAGGGRVVLLLLDRLGNRGRALQALPTGSELADELKELEPPDLGDTPEELAAWMTGLLARLGIAPGRSPGLSGPTRRALRAIGRGLGGVPRLAEAAAAAKLSPGRLSHLFSEEVGLPFRRYVLWARVQRAAQEASHGRSLTECAVAAGFSDGAHFSRTFRAHFGLPPSVVLPLIELEPSAWAEP